MTTTLTRPMTLAEFFAYDAELGQTTALTAKQILQAGD